ncbi:MAG: DUF2332 domain-containing protein [Acidobacteria bacterium]|nr:DUF2332 domain-containing protein [Acidobacteriota bacterium]
MRRDRRAGEVGARNRLNPKLEEAFLRQAEACERSGSPLYADVCRRLAADEAVEPIVGEVRWDAPIRLLGGLHFLALADGIDPWTSPHDVLVDQRDRLTRFVAEQDVQTNEVGRCFALLPAFLALARWSGKRLDLLELGPSAGLNLVFDRYAYRYVNGAWGDPSSGVVLANEERTSVPRDVLAGSLVVGRRRGIDLNPIDVASEHGVLTLTAFVWADQRARLEQLARAVAVAQAHPPELVRGDYVEVLPRVLADRDDDALTVVFQTASTQYLPRERYADLRAVAGFGAACPRVHGLSR